MVMALLCVAEYLAESVGMSLFLPIVKYTLLCFVDWCYDSGSV